MEHKIVSFAKHGKLPHFAFLDITKQIEKFIADSEDGYFHIISISHHIIATDADPDNNVPEKGFIASAIVCYTQGEDA